MTGQGSFVWYELLSPDPDGSKAFYDAVIGWDVGPAPEGALDYRMIRRAGGLNAGGVLRLTEEKRRQGATPIWLGYIAVDDVDAAHGALIEDGGRSYIAPWTIEGVGRVAMVGDRSGAPFYIIRPIPRAGGGDAAGEVFSPTEPGCCSWNELSAGSSADALAFYGRHFGWTHAGGMPMGEAGNYEFIVRNEVRLGAIMRAGEGQRPRWRYYFRVPSIDRAVQAIGEKGGTVASGPHEVPGGDHIVIGLDPQGAEFALVGQR